MPRPPYDGYFRPEPATATVLPAVPRQLPRARRTRRALAWIAGSLAALVVLTAAVGYGLLNYSEGRIQRVDVFAGLRDRPAAGSDSAQNYLLVGSDTREGLTAEQLRQLRVGSTRSAVGRRSDTMILLHISKRRDKAVLVSLPRDSYVRIPAHQRADGTTVEESGNKLNAAYNFGGPQLAVETVERATGVRVDHYVEIGFDGFARMVDALGGVSVCTPRAIHDTKSHLDLDAGRHRLDGLRSLAYVRSREFDGRGDIGRMERQQKFLGAMLREALSGGVLLNPVKLTRFLNAVLDSVQTDAGLERGDMVTLATRLRSLDPSRVTFVTVPIADDNYRPGGIGSAVRWDEPAAGALFDALREDRAVDAAPRSSTAAGAGGAADVTVAPSRVRVRVLNASGVTGLGGRTARDLAAAGFTVVGAPANAPGPGGARETVIRYDARYTQSVKTLAAGLPGARLEKVTGLGSTQQVLVGSSYAGVSPVRTGEAPRSAAPSPTGAKIKTRTAAENPCA